MDDPGSDNQQYDLEERTARFGEAIIAFAGTVKVDDITSPLVRQLVPAATSVGANYCEADEVGTKKEFEYRISVCKRDSRETKYWLRMIAKAWPVGKRQARGLWKQPNELTRIFARIHRSS
ncbi:MAG TPA: four helix bundle protein [Planctomycetes bacterium]|nr:four helix bundle protein [Planctomycetota bacterium]